MDVFIIEGGRALEGTVRVNGAKNAALPLMAAALLTEEPVVLRDVPDVADVRSMLRLLGELGCRRTSGPDPRTGTVILQTADETVSHARYDIVRTMRASICVLGPLLAKRGHARVSMPGGCAIGTRPVDLHLRGLEALGATIELDNGDIVARAPRGGLQGARIFLGGPFGSTVLGTANLMCAAVLARGTTIIESAACEPEVVDLADLLTAMGARIRGAGSPRITIEGVSTLGKADHTVIPDRIEAGTLIVAGAITGGDLVLENCPLDALMAFTDRLSCAGVGVTPIASGGDPMRQTCRVRPTDDIRPVEVTTQPHPGFPTDLQAQMMALLCLARGNSVVTEKIFPERFMHVPELQRMGARMYRRESTVVVAGPTPLVGAPVMASDLRASACLVLAAMAARGTTIVNRVYHLDRGYERLEDRLVKLGASIDRRREDELNEVDRRALAAVAAG